MRRRRLKTCLDLPATESFSVPVTSTFELEFDPVSWNKQSGLVAAICSALLLLSTNFASAQQANTIEVWKSPYCGCCTKWVDHLAAAGFKVRIHDSEQLGARKDALGVPVALRSCHTAKIGNYVVEGHVPARDIKQLLRRKPRIVGISVPGMPIGSPGMEVSSGETEPYSVIAFDRNGKTHTFAKHE